jgi:hypothetical protein
MDFLRLLTVETSPFIQKSKLSGPGANATILKGFSQKIGEQIGFFGSNYVLLFRQQKGS